MATPDATPSNGLPERIGRYRIVGRLGKGAMGVIYAAEDEAMGRRVAIKVMMADLEEERETRERFFREARVTGQLLHRNIVLVLDLGEEQGRPYIVMERLSGLPLAEYLRTPDAQSLDAKISLMMQLCDGLQAAHDRGVTHRDIKPSNLFVLPDGTLKILDFGVARLATSTLTASGLLVGTPNYMSPEQARGLTVDARSDVFSAAGVCYFALTGRAPFESPDLPKVLHAVIHEPPAPLGDVEAPEQLRCVLMKALEKNPNERYQQCAQMRTDLERVQLALESETRRVAQAALERYRRVLALVEERRTLGRRLAEPGVDARCESVAMGLAQRFPMFAARVDHSSLLEPIDPAVAGAALDWLQQYHDTERAAVEAMRARVVEGNRPEPARDVDDLTLRRARPRDALDQGVDRTLVMTSAPARGADRRSFVRARAAALFGRWLGVCGASRRSNG